MSGDDTAFPHGVRRWIEARTGGSVVSVERQGRWRPHWLLTVEGPEGRQDLLLRGERDPTLIADSSFLSHFSLARESRVLAALQTTDVLVPRYFGFHEPSQTILMERVAGGSEFAQIADPAERKSVAEDYFTNLAALHRLDPHELDLGDISVPETAEEAAFGKYKFQERDYLKAKPAFLRPEPLLEYGRWWLRQNMPDFPSALSFVQGDTGPGQFMFEEGRVTALIDWELAHVGNPMLDLGNMRMRNLLYPMGDLGAYFDHYEREVGRPIDVAAVRFFTVQSMLLSPIGMADSLQRPSAQIGSMIPRFGWDVTLRKGLCEALAEAMDFKLEKPHIGAPEHSVRLWLFDFLTEHLSENCMVEDSSSEQAYQLRAALGLAEALTVGEQYGRAVELADLEDLGKVLGRTPASIEEGIRQVSALVDANPAELGEEFVSAFYRVECRREFLWAPLMVAQASVDLEPLNR